MTSFEPKSAPASALVWGLQIKISKKLPLTPEELQYLRSESQTTQDFDVARSIMSCFQWLNDPSNIPFVEPYLHKGDAYAADVAVWTLCWLGYGQHIKDYMIGCLEPGMPWDETEDLMTGVPRAVGHHLLTHKDRDLAQLLVRWRRRATRSCSPSPMAGVTTRSGGSGMRRTWAWVLRSGPTRLP